MITEDYVSFETAKLLKEKGFSCDEISCINVFKGHTYKIQDTIIEADEDVTIPTIQLAIKWLREKHNQFIDIDPLTHHRWAWSIWLMNDPNQKMGESLWSVATYEEACESVIKYCLENLI